MIAIIPTNRHSYSLNVVKDYPCNILTHILRAQYQMKHMLGVWYRQKRFI